MSSQPPEPARNSYLEEVLQQQEVVARELRKSPRQEMSSNMAPAPMATRGRMVMGGGGPEASPSSGGGDVRVVGWWRFKTVIVPPNVYAVHTRKGHAEPLHIGLGQSFSYDPSRDAFLTMPAAMQTIAINARCICKERQGILVQAYVQWIIADIQTAYRRLDFSDTEDPMKIVNVQLREQAEAAIKDKVSTMGIDEVLADKQPIIEDLILRLRSVAEGKEGEGLGLKIVTVQIKEAVVSSTRLWQNLQTPFRAEQARIADLAQIDNERVVTAMRLTQRREAELAELAARRTLEETRAREEAIIESTQAAVALEVALAKARHAVALAEARTAELAAQVQVDAAEAERARTQQAARLTRELDAAKAEVERAEGSLSIDEKRRAIEANVSEGMLQRELIQALPKLAAHLPRPDKSEQIILHGGAETPALGALVAFVKVVQELFPKAKREA